MPGHALDQIMRHPEAHVGPVAVALEIAPRDPGRGQEPHQEKRRLQQTARARCQHEDCDDDFNERDQGEKSSAEGERFHCLRFEHASQQLPRALMAEAVGIEAQRSEEEPLLQKRACADCDPALQLRNEDAQWDQGQQEQRPRNQPAAVRSTAQNI